MGNINHVCCRAWLSELLADGEPHNVENIRAERKKAGYTKGEVNAAKKIARSNFIQRRKFT